MNQYTDTVRRDSYDLEINTDEEQRLLRDLLDAVGSTEVVWLRLSEGSALVGQTLAGANLPRPHWGVGGGNHAAWRTDGKPEVPDRLPRQKIGSA